MDTVFEALIFLAIGLIAITVTVFVLAVSLLGRAIKLSLQEQTEAEEKGNKETEEGIKKIKDKLDESTSGHTDIDKLKKSLTDLEKQQNKHKSKLKWIKTKPRLLRVDGGVLLPGTFFLVSIIFSTIARYILSQNSEANVLGYLIVSIGFIIYGIFTIIQSLKVIESVAITSEEIALTRQKEMYKTAIMEIEDMKRPEISVYFENNQPPFSMKADSENKLLFRIFVNKGNIAKNCKVFFWIPPNFTVIEHNQGPISETKPDYISAEFDIGDILKPLKYHRHINLKAPSKKGKYSAAYACMCENFNSKTIEFDIVVE